MAVYRANLTDKKRKPSEPSLRSYPTLEVSAKGRKRASLRVKSKITNFVENKLHLKINEQKSQICRPIQYFTLGYGFIPTYKKGEKGKYDLRVNPKSFKRLKQKIKEVTRKTLPLPFTVRLYKLEAITRGWINYYRFANITGKLKDLDAWVRNRLRYCIWNRALASS